MFAGSLVVARKELLDHFRDTRSLLSSLLYALMGPLIVGAVATRVPLGGTQASVMASVFVLVAAFAGGTSVAADTIAGERERHSLLSLILSSPFPTELLIGKWLAAWAFAMLGALVSAFGFLLLLAALPSVAALDLRSLAPLLPALATLTALAAALQILLSCIARSAKEAGTYLATLTFLVMGWAMWFAFRPASATDWWLMMPVTGQQRLFQEGFAGQGHSPPAAAALMLTSSAFVVAILLWTVKLFRRNKVDFRN